MNDHANNPNTKEQLAAELAKWQTKMDEAKLQMHLGAKEAQEMIQPHVDQLEQDLIQAKGQLEQLDNNSEEALKDLHHGFKMSVKSMQKAFEKAQQHFKEDEKK